jgi:hypothetical protein
MHKDRFGFQSSSLREEMCEGGEGEGWRSHQEMRLEAQKAESSVAATVTDPTLCRCTVTRVINATTLGI